jgi:hypothetical protein
MTALDSSEIVFKDGIGYDSHRLLDSLKGRYGEYLFHRCLTRRYSGAIPRGIKRPVDCILPPG